MPAVISCWALRNVLEAQPKPKQIFAQPVNALVISVEKATDEEFDYTVKRCRYAEMYREMGLGHIGHLLSCNRDYMFPQGYNPDIELERTQTLMEGASCCDFKYRYGKRQEGQQE